MLKTCPDPVDVQDIQFKLHCSLKIFNNTELETFRNNHSLVSCASRYGLLFVGSNSPLLRVIQLKTVENYTPKDKEISNFPRRNVPLPSLPKHVCVNCDSTILAVIVEKDNCAVVIFYDVLSFYKKDINVIKEIRLSLSPGVFALEVNWNPALPGIFTVCKNDGSLKICEIKGNTVDINELPQAAECTSFCWSPKGKQIAVGSKNGKITQYKPDLKAVKVINSPTFDKHHSLICLCWVSNYQFIGIYQDLEEHGQAKLVVVDAPKTGETSYTNYDDVCYSGSSRTSQFYLVLLQHWNMLMIASSNSMELGLLGAVNEVWTQWNVLDFARAELPLSADKQDTLPIGMGLDISNVIPLPWGEGIIPPCPYLLLLSHHGSLYFFNIVNLKQGMPSICCPPDGISDLSGIGEFVVEDNGLKISSTPQDPKSSFSFGALQPQPQPTIQSPQISQPAFSFVKPFVAPQSSIVPNTSLISKPIDTKILLGSQVTITPIKPHPPEISSSNAPINLTPIPHTQNIEKYSSVFAALKAPSIVSTSEVKPIVISTQNVKPEPALETPKSAILETPRTIVESRAAVDEKLKVETDALLAKMVKDECMTLESELKALLHQGRKVNVNIGSDEEKMRMVEQLQDLQEFIKDIVDVSLGESAEVHSLKQNLILSWAWYEEALSRYNVSKDETVTLLVKSQPLDSAAEKRQTDIRKIIYYLESQLYQASKALDEQWDKFQDYAKKTYRVQMPTMETIFQSMVRQNAVLQKQSYVLKDINNRLKNKKGPSTTPSLFLSLNNTDKLEEDLSRLQLDRDDGHRIFYEQSFDKVKKLSYSKRSKLRNLLNVREVTHVTVAKPNLNTTISLLRSPTTRSKEIFSILGARMSPVTKKGIVKNIQFSESTPVKHAHEIKPTVVPPNTPAQPDPQKTFTFKEVTVIPPSTSFVPKSTSLLSNISQNQSAFVPTIPTTKAFIVPASTVSNLSFNFSTKDTTTVSQINFGSSISITPVSHKKSAVTTNTVSTPKAPLNFSTSFVNLFSASPTITSSKSLFSDSSLPESGQSLFSFGKTTDDTASTLSMATSVAQTFSFGKTTDVSATSAAIKSPHLGTITSPVSFGKTTASVISLADSTTKQKDVPSTKSTLTSITASSLPKTTVTTVSNSSKPLNFGSTNITTTKSINFGSIPSKLTTPSSTFTFNPTTTSSLFGGAITTTTTSLFGSITTPSVTSSIFATATSDTTTPTTIENTKSSSSSATSIFNTGTSTTTNTKSILDIVSTSPKDTTSTSIFGSNTPPVCSTTPAFGTNSSVDIVNTESLFAVSAATTPTIFPSTTSKTSTTGFLFASTAAPIIPDNIFGGTTIATSTNSATPLVTTSTTQGSALFGATTKSSIFSGTTINPPSIFGSPGTTTQASAFGTPIVSTQQSSIFGASTTQQSIFGSTTPNATTAAFSTTTQASIFASPAFGTTVTTSEAPIFAPTTNTSVFGASTTCTSPVLGANAISTVPVFGATTTSNTPIFGNSTTSNASVFGGTATTTQTSIFGAPFGATPTTQTSIFGSTSPVSPTNSNSIFDTASTTVPAFGTNFAQSGSIFGEAKTTGNIFGSSSTFGTAPVTTAAFGQPAQFGGTTGSIFGTPTTSSSAFGSGSSAFGTVSSSGNAFGTSSFSFASAANSMGSLGFGDSNDSATSSIFGGNPSFGQTASNPFARATDQKSPFGGTFGTQSTTTSFGTPSSTTGSIFGSNTGSVFGSNTQNVFGSPSGFGQQSTFGQSNFGNSSFGNTQPGPFSGGGVGVGQSGFGSPGSFQKTSTGFGAAPVFGGSPQSAFGASPNFGGSPAFGGTATFGSPPKVFGAPAPSSAFGQPTGNASAGFGNLAAQNTVGFGSLAQQAATPSSAPFSGSSSFSSWR